MVHKTFLTRITQKCSLYWLWYVYTWTGKRTSPVISTVVSKMKDCSRSHTVTYTERVVIYRKSCKIQTSIPPSKPTTNGNRYTAHPIMPFAMTLSDLQGHLPIAGHFKCDFSHSDRISTDRASRGAWMIAELLVLKSERLLFVGDGATPEPLSLLLLLLFFRLVTSRRMTPLNASGVAWFSDSVIVCGHRKSKQQQPRYHVVVRWPPRVPRWTTSNG